MKTALAAACRWCQRLAATFLALVGVIVSAGLSGTTAPHEAVAASLAARPALAPVLVAKEAPADIVEIGASSSDDLVALTNPD